MKITVEDSSMVNWDTVLEKVTAEVQARTTEVVAEAQRVLSQLKPGERRTIPIRVGAITVSVPNAPKK